MDRATLIFLLALGCASPAENTDGVEPVHTPTAGAEAPDDSDPEPASEENQGGLIGVRGDQLAQPGQGGGGTGEGIIGTGTFGGGPLTPEEQAAAEARRQSRQAEAAARRATAEAEYQARCANVTLTPGLPPVPPQPPSTPSIDALRTSYEASLAAPLTGPQDNSMAAVNEWAQTVFAQWVQLYASRLQALDQAEGTIPETDRQYARAWVAHAYAVFVERFHSAPIPDEIQRDPQLRTIYVDAIADQSEPLLQRVVQTVDGVTLPGPWASWKAQMETWLAQEACGLH